MSFIDSWPLDNGLIFEDGNVWWPLRIGWLNFRVATDSDNNDVRIVAHINRYRKFIENAILSEEFHMPKSVGITSLEPTITLERNN